MPSPFPGMDPYLERAGGWPNIHQSLIAALRRWLQARLRPRYAVIIEEWVYIAQQSEYMGRPDLAIVGLQREVGTRGGVATAEPSLQPLEVFLPTRETIREPYLLIRGPLPADEVVAAVELLSPANKRRGRGQDEYLARREGVLLSLAHLLEIDLLRAGERMPASGRPEQYNYSILVSDARRRPSADFYSWSVRDPIPEVPLPLAGQDEQIVVDLGSVLASEYDEAGFDLLIDYTRAPEPPLSPEDEAWADTILRERGLRHP